MSPWPRPCSAAWSPAALPASGALTGLVELSVAEAQRRHGLATFLLNEAFRQFLRQGIMRVEVQAGETNAAALAVFQKLGLQRTGQGGVWRKDL